MGCTPSVGQNHYDRGRTLNLAEVEVYSFPPPPSPPAPGPVILEGSTAGYRCSVTALTMINTAAECQAAASALGLTYIGVNTGAHYQDGCSVYLGNKVAGPLVYFNPRTRVNGGQCVHVNGDTSDGSCNHKSICH